MLNYKIAYLTDSQTTLELSAGDDLLIQELKKFAQVDIIPWEVETNYTQYELTLVRTTWDYMDKTKKFLQILKKVSSESRLINSLETIKWNINKKYLLELQALGFPIIPTALSLSITNENMPALFTQIDQGAGVIIKPTIGASSQGIQLLKSPKDLKELFSGEWFIQPFQKSIQTHGEFSLFYFNNHYSHAINKMPKAGEFRSQEEFDSTVTKINPDTSWQQLGSDILKKIPVQTHYARVDMVLDKNEKPQIIELELIEPCLFFKYSPESAINFSHHIKYLLEV